MVFVKVVDGKRKTYCLRKELRERGFSFSSLPEPHWYAEIADEDFETLKMWCFRKRLGMICSKNERSGDYRRRFFEGGQYKACNDKYFCSYCGRLLSEDKVCVDHVISVNKAQTSLFYFDLIERLGFESVNDVRNLVPACRRCNARKGAKGRIWVLKGFVGRFPAFWMVFRSVELVLVAWLLVWLVNTLL